MTAKTALASHPMQDIKDRLASLEGDLSAIMWKRQKHLMETSFSTHDGQRECAVDIAAIASPVKLIRRTRAHIPKA